ncbi:VPLPA-CTERM-specific exosortase XrtD [Hyphococcus luteus]|uniref:VPLPA-CTERM-specific exosortase XrtD n=1 Tax=Hyphococcus luteus TaxID=2058213 RepID=A0A2S7K477_9PROT|nr:VPLPA-CTERM-specific exosortase XrtD [Marinicaulis flavus]PQA87299.1 VPLPA-CTERM-specific exosortase XrtD [Marinicaulis flavus]
MSDSNTGAGPSNTGFTVRPIHVLAVVGAVTVFAFWGGIENLFKRWGEQQELSHGYFLPLISAWMIWARRDALRGSLGKPALLGLAGVAISAIVLVLSELTVTSLMIFQHLAMILLFSSLALGLGGWRIFWLTLLPIGFMLFMVPPPYWVITVLSQQFQLWSSQLGVAMIDFLGIPVFLSGNIIDLGDYKLQVAEACSGLRYLFPFLSLGFLAAYLFQAPLWQRAIVFLSTIPITILMNSFRIAVTGVLVQRFGTEHAEGFIHMFEGWVVFILCLALLFGIIAILARISGKKPFTELLGLPDIEARPAADKWTKDRFMLHAGISIALIAAAGAYVHFGISNILRIPDRTDLAGLPYELEGWRSDVQHVDSATVDVLGADDYIITNLTSPEDERFNLYIAYLDMQRHGHSWHSPRQCIPGGGWQIVDHQVEEATLSDGSTFHYNRIVIENRGARQLLYYWYDQRSRRIANEFVMKTLLIFDAVRLRRTDGAMIRIMTPVSQGEALENADVRLQGFMNTLDPLLDPYIPPEDAPTTRSFDPNEYE